MAQTIACPECGAPLADDAPKGLCPACLLRGGKSSSPRSANDPGETGAPVPGFVAPATEEIRDYFPQLEIVELLGQGGMGAVYKAKQKMLDRTVALKILPPDTRRDPTFSERFTREAKAMAKLGHPNIVIVFEFGEVRGLYYLIMEYIDGVNLRQAIHAQQVSAEQALSVVPQICDALQYAHEEGIVHRDIKPENVLLDKKGRVKIADFGLAKLLGRSPIDVTLTASQQVMGTLHYMAPEQLESPLSVDHRADIYSLGVVFYELLTGELPLGRFRLPSERATLDARLDEVVLKTLERAPEERYQHASEVKLDVETISRDHQPGPTGHPMKAERVGSRPLSLPFSTSDATVLGMPVVFGIARFNGRDLSLEFDAKDINDGPLKSNLQDVVIPVTDIVSAVFQPGILKHTAVVQTDYLRSRTELPGIARGKIRLYIDRVDRETAESFVAAVRRTLAGQAWEVTTESTTPAEAKQPVADTEADVDEARRKLVGPALGLTVAGALAMLWLMGMVFFSFALLIDRDVDAPAAVVASLLAAYGVAIVVPAVNLVSLRWYGWAVIATVLGLLPLSPALVVSVPCAIWMLFVIVRPDVRAAFEQVGSRRAAPQATLMVELYALWDRVQEWCAALLKAPPHDLAQPASAFVAAAPQPDHDMDAARRRLWGPGMALTVVGAINLLSLVFLLANLVIEIVEFKDIGHLSRRMEDFAEHTWFLWLSIPLGFVMFFGGRSTRKLGSHRLAMAGAIAALIPCSPAFVLSAPVGIWAFMVLMAPGIRASFADNFPHPQSHSRVPAKPVSVDHAAALARVAWPASCLRVVALVGFLPPLILAGFGLFEVFEHFPRVDWDDHQAVEFFLIALAEFVLHIPTIALLLFASWKMRQLRFRGLAIFASIVAMLPCHLGFILGLPVGIWSLMLLSRQDMIEAFSARTSDQPSPAACGAR